MRWFARTEQLLGKAAYARLTSARVVICGLGGVGSAVCEALARAGVGHLRLVDYDVVNPTNLNRQLLALRSTLGQSKAHVAEARVLDINPACDVDARPCFLNNASVEDLLAPPLDLIIDAIDSVNAKAGLLEYAWKRQLPVISSMGAGGRMDGAAIQVGDLFDTVGCPLARMIRKRLVRRGVGRGIRCVFTSEPCRNDLQPMPEDVDTHDGPGRKRTPLGTLSYMPALFGFRLAEEAIKTLLAHEPVASGAIEPETP